VVLAVAAACAAPAGGTPDSAQDGTVPAPTAETAPPAAATEPPAAEAETAEDEPTAAPDPAAAELLSPAVAEDESYKGLPVGFTEDGKPYRGDPDAPIVMIEYSDFGCP